MGKPDVGRVVAEKDGLGRPRVQSVNTEPSETVQSDAHLADMDNILRAYGAGDGKIMAMLDETELRYKDVSEFTDLGDALRQAEVANVEFMKLPSKVREIFDHDVAVWLDTSQDQEKRDALVAGGFLVDPNADKDAVREGGAGGSKDPPNPDEVQGGAREEEGAGLEAGGGEAVS